MFGLRVQWIKLEWMTFAETLGVRDNDTWYFADHVRASVLETTHDLCRDHAVVDGPRLPSVRAELPELPRWCGLSSRLVAFGHEAGHGHEVLRRTLRTALGCGSEQIAGTLWFKLSEGQEELARAISIDCTGQDLVREQPGQPPAVLETSLDDAEVAQLVRQCMSELRERVSERVVRQLVRDYWERTRARRGMPRAVGDVVVEAVRARPAR